MSSKSPAYVRERFEIIKTNTRPLDIPSLFISLPERCFWAENVGPIHPLFRIEQFSNVDFNCSEPVSFFDHPMSPEYYKRIKPALRLATIMFEDAHTYFAATLFGRRYKVQKPDGTSVEMVNSELPIDEPSELAPMFDAAVQDIANSLRICWTKDTTTGSGCCHHAIWGEAYNDYLPYIHNLSKRIMYRAAATDRVFIPFGDAGWASQPIDAKCAAWLSLAEILVHELAHVFNFWQQREDTLARTHVGGSFFSYDGEPRFEGFEVAELGMTWEHLYFGGDFVLGKDKIYQPCGRRTWMPTFDGSRGIWYYETSLNPGEGNARTVVGGPMLLAPESLVTLFHENTWTSNKPIRLFVLSLRSGHGINRYWVDLRPDELMFGQHQFREASRLRNFPARALREASSTFNDRRHPSRAIFVPDTALVHVDRETPHYQSVILKDIESFMRNFVYTRSSAPFGFGYLNTDILASEQRMRDWLMQYRCLDLSSFICCIHLCTRRVRLCHVA